ncbi:MAG: helix-turn-helix domain-containing protein [Candidatus Symbiothrix sp.]|jgi:transcriptional regulator with XRE-family HTH domain|nr:helix-turn-helix domain-containing protein [Candidatus Symbiothrix sp.]
MLLGKRIRELREEKQLLQRQLAAALEIDTPMYSKIERGDRKAKRKQVLILADLLQADPTELLTLWVADQVIVAVADEKEVANNALDIVKQYINNDKVIENQL